MAENNLARSRNDVPDVFADGDPLAELARIVGYEDRVVTRPEPAAPVSAAKLPRREPAFNLEDELLREFERYDAPSPSLDPVNDIGPVEPLAMPVAFEPAHEEAFIEPVETMVADDVADSGVSSASDWAGDASSLPHSARWADDTGLRHAVEAFGQSQPQLHSIDAADPVMDAMPAAVEADVELDVSPVLAPDHVVDEQPDLSGLAAEKLDLASELETSVSMPQVAPVPDARRKPGYTPSFRMPLANFQSAAGVERFQPVEQKPAPVERLTPVWDAPTASSSPLVAPVSIPLAGPAESVMAKPSVDTRPMEESARFSELDELLYDVDRYSVSGSAAPAMPPLDGPRTLGAEAVVSKLEPVEIAGAQSPASSSPVVANESADLFADLEFELALDDLELDLADMVVAENSKDMRSASPDSVAPVEPVPQVAPASAMASPKAVEPVVVASAPVYAAASTYIQPAQPRVETAQPSARNDEPEDDVAFDPALIAEAEEQPEAIAELDVPALPVEVQEEPPLYRSDFDLDIDAELASLLGTPDAQAPIQAEAAAPSAPAAAKQSVYADLDDFERALEEDFRRSLATPLPAGDQYAPVASYEESVDEGQARSSVKRWIAPLAAVGVIAIFGGAAYAFLGGSTGGASGNGEPVVIAADTDPVKVAPENPGGKTVPNQDKAVYDRVAGGTSETPKQQQLISSSEEPVDVVQKTLMPESLPLEGENDMQMTDVSETDDPRLLPQDQAAAPQASEQQAVAVMPRKVKTMIVRADGKLVEQEVEQPTPSATIEKVAAAPVRGDDPITPSQTAAPFPTSAEAPASPASSVVPVSAQVTAPSEMAMPSAAQAPAAIEQLAEPAQTATVRAPVPMIRPAQQPVNVVAAVSDQGNVRPAAAAPAAAAPAAAQNTQVASLGEGGYVIQIASLPSQADAQKSYQNLSNKFGSVIGGRGVDIKSAEIAGKGTFYRVRIPAGSKTEAVALCERYRAAGGSCLVAR